MAKAEILPGICGFTTIVTARKNGKREIALEIESGCRAIQRLGEALTAVDPYREFTFRGEGPLTLQLASKHCSHAACPVASGIIKAIEIEAGLALPADVHITLSRDDAK